MRDVLQSADSGSLLPSVYYVALTVLFYVKMLDKASYFSNKASHVLFLAKLHFFD